MDSPASPDRDETSAEDAAPPSARFLPYPVSTLSPKILPNDLTTYKSRGISQVQRAFQQRIRELHEEYRSLVDQFNWNKLIYESRFGFEPNLGQTYQLYDLRGKHTLSMIEPQQWRGKTWLGSFQLHADGQWKPVELSENFDLQTWVESELTEESAPGATT